MLSDLILFALTPHLEIFLAPVSISLLESKQILKSQQLFFPNRNRIPAEAVSQISITKGAIQNLAQLIQTLQKGTEYVAFEVEGCRLLMLLNSSTAGLLPIIFTQNFKLKDRTIIETIKIEVSKSYTLSNTFEFFKYYAKELKILKCQLLATSEQTALSRAWQRYNQMKSVEVQERMARPDSQE